MFSVKFQFTALTNKLISNLLQLLTLFSSQLLIPHSSLPFNDDDRRNSYVHDDAHVRGDGRDRRNNHDHDDGGDAHVRLFPLPPHLLSGICFRMSQGLRLCHLYHQEHKHSIPQAHFLTWGMADSLRNSALKVSFQNLT